MANLICDNGANTITVGLMDGSTWTVTGDSVITEIILEEDASVIVEEGVTLTVDGQEYDAGTYTSDDFSGIAAAVSE